MKEQPLFIDLFNIFAVLFVFYSGMKFVLYLRKRRYVKIKTQRAIRDHTLKEKHSDFYKFLNPENDERHARNRYDQTN